jgi:hypothetical protein
MRFIRLIFLRFVSFAQFARDGRTAYLNDPTRPVNLLYVCPLSVNFSSLSAPGVANVRNIACEVFDCEQCVDFRHLLCYRCWLMLIRNIVFIRTCVLIFANRFG